ncbi:hypothetical protein OXPF_39250 [Oxobacter pfennigii]|uniref:Helix-turn-helix domain-containing protein n=1 Tax=Oxobacter pfennigii TaxID=36849 RepID=A0A0P8Y6V0_9CLOT|nr:helix-turn-helix domain-containing protein [Oxobacter pfennigii]KPU42146.1 hypothetical protein OXPF_39250 [Oxobacter pfennigii]
MENELYNVLTFPEATQMWNLSESTLRKAIGTAKRLEEGVDYRKSGSVWLIRKSSMERVYGKLK